MRRLHLWVGVLTVVAFLATGQFMRYHEPPMNTYSDGVRLMFRSRHIYILASGLVNLMLGVYVERRGAGWRRTVQGAGSGLLIMSPIFLVMAFLVEPERGFRPELFGSRTGLYMLFAGCMAHMVSATGASAKGARPKGGDAN